MKFQSIIHSSQKLGAESHLRFTIGDFAQNTHTRQTGWIIAIASRRNEIRYLELELLDGNQRWFPASCIQKIIPAHISGLPASRRESSSSQQH